MRKPKIFIGSSSEGIAIAEAMFACLASHTEPTLWTHELFPPGQYPLEALEKQVRRHAFAILIASPDDQIIKRGVTSPAMRDNLLLEFGLFTGALGRRRTFFVCPNAPRIELPSDAAGVITATYDASRVKAGPDEIAASVQVACQQIRHVIEAEWNLIQNSMEQTTSQLQASKKGQAIRRLHGVAIELRDALMTLQRDTFAAISDEQVFEDLKRRSAERIRVISQSFAEDASIIGADASLQELSKITIKAILDLPFPRELSLGRKAAERQAFNVGMKALDSFLSGGDPMRDVQEVASNETEGLVRSLRERYAEWWDRYCPQLQAAAVSMQDALFRAAMDLGSAAYFGVSNQADITT